MTHAIPRKQALLSAAIAALLLNAPVGEVSAASKTSISLGADSGSGDYGTRDSTTTTNIPFSIKHETGDWTLRASLPYVRAEGTFNRDQGIDPLGSTVKQRENGVGDLTLGVVYTLFNTNSGYSLDLGGKAKISTSNKNTTLIRSGENDYSIQLDGYRSLSNMALFATLGYTIKGEPTGVRYRNPLFTSLGLSVPLPWKHTIGAAWDFRQKVTRNGDPVSELTAFYSLKLNPENKMQIYLVRGLSNGSADFGGGLVYTHVL